MAIVRVKDKHTGVETAVSEEWLERWPDDFDALEDAEPGVEYPAPISQQPGGNPTGIDQTNR
jgi:hypothetical protein